MANQEEILAYIRQQAPFWVSSVRLKVVMGDSEVGRKLIQLAKIGFIESTYLVNKEGKNEKIVRFRGETKSGGEF